MGHKKPFIFLLLGSAVLILYVSLSQCKSKKTDAAWTAPGSAASLKNPLEDLSLAQRKGKELYDLYCWSCHGKSGYGDGAAGKSFDQKPANFHETRIKKEADGELFWKINTGKGNMPSFKDALSEEQRWQLISYLRKLASTKGAPSSPRALWPDIKVAHVMNIGPLGVRILLHPVTGDIYYTTFDGDVFWVKNLDSARPVAVKILSVKDHGITRLQGAAFLQGSLFLCGNVDQNSKKSTHGRMMRAEFDSSGHTRMSVVFNTVEYAANKTIYDHGWNALATSPDGKYIFINSGARTDHGEVQDNGGLYPHARDNALTAKIFRLPSDAKDLELTDDEAKLKASGYIYAEGVRNAYDMAFDPYGNLFAVVNSSDYDHPEDMFWVRQGHHYGFPWIMGGLENPQQFPGWKPDPDTDPFINKFAHSWRVKYFHDDPDFPKIPAGVKFSPGVQNLGPDANEYRGHSGKILDGDITGVTVSTFTPHSSPLGIFFDTEKILSKDFKSDGFVIRYSMGATTSLMKPFTDEGSDLLHLHLTYDSATDNFFVKTTRIVDGFNEPVDAVMKGNDVYIIEYGGIDGNIWKITLPKEVKSNTKNGSGKKTKP